MLILIPHGHMVKAKCSFSKLIINYLAEVMKLISNKKLPIKRCRFPSMITQWECCSNYIRDDISTMRKKRG